MQVICLILFYSFDNLPNVNSGGLFAEANLQTLAFRRLDDGFDLCVYESTARQLHASTSLPPDSFTLTCWPTLKSIMRIFLEDRRDLS